MTIDRVANHFGFNLRPEDGEIHLMRPCGLRAGVLRKEGGSLLLGGPVPGGEGGTFEYPANVEVSSLAELCFALGLLQEAWEEAYSTGRMWEREVRRMGLTREVPDGRVPRPLRD
jgi:hypothetical protein